MHDTLIVRKVISSEKELEQEMRLIGADPAGIAIMQPKFRHFVVKVTDISTPAALIVKQEMLSKGGEVVIPYGMITHSVPAGSILLSGTHEQYRQLIKKLQLQPFGLQKVAGRIADVLNGTTLPPLTMRERTFNFTERTYLMGILNVTPDSFSDGGRYTDTERALDRALELEREGADIIDIGGQSTRPGAEGVSPETECARILPVIRAIRHRSEIPISVDTYSSKVAEAALQAGADIINDISGLKFDPVLASVAATYDCPIVVMHILGTPRDMQEAPCYTDLMTEIIQYLDDSIDIATQAGVSRDRIIVDPGIGFGKTLEHNFTILSRLGELRSLGCPILIGTSRKSLIGKVLGGTPEERLEGTAVTNALAIWNGASILRVHDVREMRRVARMTDAIKQNKGG